MGLLTTIGMPQTPWFHVGKTMPLAPAMTGNGNGFSIPPAKKIWCFFLGDGANGIDFTHRNSRFESR